MTLDEQPRRPRPPNAAKAIEASMSADMIAAIAELTTIIDRLESVAATESPIVSNMVRDALCHVQLGADLLDRLQPR